MTVPATETQKVTLQVFKNAAMPYAAFCLRDPYYREMASLVLTEVKQAKAVAHGRFRSKDVLGVDLGAGIGISALTMVRDFDRMVVVEPDDSARAMLELNFFCNPRVRVTAGKAENLSAILREDELGKADVVTCCQMMHLLKDVLDQSLSEIAKALTDDGILVFDFGPSNWEFTSHKLTDHRSGGYPAIDEIMTELAHPLYQRAHQIVYNAVCDRYPEFKEKHESLWPSAAKRYNREEMGASLTRAGLKMVRVTEIMVPITGERVLDFIRNGWAVFFRWSPLDALPVEEKIAFMEPAMRELYADPHLEYFKSIVAYHPTAIITAQKA